jgi:hypothetical protein
VRRRPRRAIPAALLALALLAICAAVVWSLIQRLTGAREFIYFHEIAARLHIIAWDDSQVLIAGAVTAPAGLVLLALAVWPGRAVMVPLAGAEDFAAGVDRRGLRGALRDAAQSVEGVRSARVRLRRNRVRVTARTGYARTASLAEAVSAAVGERIDRIGACPAPRVFTRLRAAGVR